MFLFIVGYTTDDLRFIWQSGDPVQLEKIALPQFDIKKEDIEYGNWQNTIKALVSNGL